MIVMFGWLMVFDVFFLKKGSDIRKIILIYIGFWVDVSIKFIEGFMMNVGRLKISIILFCNMYFIC